MTWQDILIAIANLGFWAMLLPSILGKDKPSMWTSLGTSLLLIAILIAYLSLKLWVSSGAIFLTIISWLVLFQQVLRRNRKTK